MAVTAGQFSITFDKVNGVFILEDTTDYAGQSKPLTDVYGNFKIISPAGLTIHNNISPTTPDIDANVSLINNTIPLPLDSNGNVLCGAYSFTYSITDTSDSSVTVVTSAISYTYKSPEIELNISYDCAKPELISEDETNYLVDGVLPTTSVFDHNLFYPPTTGAATINAAADLITTNVFYTLKNVGLQHSSDLTVDLTYDFPLYSVIDQISGNEFEDVICDPGLCDIFCGLYSLWNKYLEKKGSKCANEYLEKFLILSNAAQLVRQAYDCGQSSKIPSIIEEIKLQGNFADECCCDDDSAAPILVTGVGASSNSVVAAGTGIIVGAVVAGTTTTYTVSVDPVVLSNILNITDSIVSAGVGVSVTSATVGNTTTYTVSADYSLTDNVIPVYNSISQDLEDSNMSWDGTELSATGDLELTKTGGVSVIKQVDKNPVSEQYVNGNFMDSVNAGITYSVFNGLNNVTGVYESGFAVYNGNTLEGESKLYKSGADVLLVTQIVDGVNSLLKVNRLADIQTSLTDGTDTTSEVIIPSSKTINSPLFRIDDARAVNGSNYFLVDEAITVKKESLGTAISIGSNTTPGDYTNVIIGDSANSAGTTGSIAIGQGSGIGVLGVNSVAVGESTSVSGANSVAVGSGANGGGSSVMIGEDATCGDSSVVIGASSSATDDSISLGSFLISGAVNNITIGNGTSTPNPLVNTEAKSLLVGFSDVASDKLIHIGRNKTSNYLGGTGTFEFSNQDSGLVQSSKWNFHDGDVEIVNTGSGVIVKSPDNTRWRITVSNAGAISIAAA